MYAKAKTMIQNRNMYAASCGIVVPVESRNVSGMIPATAARISVGNHQRSDLTVRFVISEAGQRSAVERPTHVLARAGVPVSVYLRLQDNPLPNLDQNSVTGVNQLRRSRRVGSDAEKIEKWFQKLRF